MTATTYAVELTEDAVTKVSDPPRRERSGLALVIGNPSASGSCACGDPFR
ncbi:hypothetical protein [Streptomyces violaceorubidus]|uniref:Uncharacterized protein n=1 Tax=Streptomyces violaceorubidus TaxID=284042 RepID=A0ABV1T387_9ACTN